MSYSHELIAKLKKAQSPEEVAELLKTDGQDEALAEQLWSELSRNHRENADELSPDELEAVSGGENCISTFGIINCKKQI